MPPALRLLRPANVALSLAVVASGGALARGAAAFGPPFLAPLLLAMVSGALVGAGANADNDGLDAEADRVNRPLRPVPSGAVSADVARGLWIGLTALALGAAALVSGGVLAVAAASAALTALYNRRLKGVPLAGNVAVAAVVAAAPLYGALAVGRVDAAVVAAVALTFGLTLAREIAKDVEDTPGDRRAGVRTMPVAWGERRSVVAALAVTVATLVALPLAVLGGVERSFLAYGLGAALCLLVAAWALALGLGARGAVARRAATSASRWLKGAMAFGLAALLATALG